MSCFSDQYHRVHLFQQENGHDGLYKNQIGSIGAVLAHFSTKHEPALVAMPTGTGKTAVMIILSYLLRGNKILVITPSQIVRKQIAEQFRYPKLLINKGILPQHETLPNVFEVVNIIIDQDEWKTILNENDVIVGIPLIPQAKKVH